ncbi:hypothetical protein [Phormidium tenue]|uniref:Uncharacterized protein n=1 Tax=Phormidium tenue FACHB-1050 TaxID=2692857 RepID=A0ABR8C881_9CYAN|nr:hypothetical protein [Phormidium tenue]MBD2316551.1 hypothetical protein [Phormidium tenue FACHB-1050]
MQSVNQKRYKHFEKELAVECLLKFELRGRAVSCFVLKQGQSSLESLQFVFGWESKGIHTTLSTEQESSLFEAIQSGLKDIPDGEKLTVHFGSVSSDSDRQQQLQELYEQADTPQLKFLVMGEKQRVQELAKSGLRKPKFLRLYATYTLRGATAGGNDVLEKALAWIQRLSQQLMGQEKEIEQERHEIAFAKAFTDGFLNWEQILVNRMGLDLRPLTEHELWEHLWRQFNSSNPPTIPQLLVMSERGVEERINTQVHLKTLLLERPDSIPFADNGFVHLKGEYIGVLTFMDKPGGWVSKGKQMRYLWEAIARDSVANTEVFCQFTRANETIVKANMQRVTKQSIVSQEQSASLNNINVNASLKQQKAVKAQEALYEGAMPINVAVAVLIRRPNLIALDDACRYFCSCFQRPAWVERETEYAWLMWKQTLPVTMGNLLAQPFPRRHVYLSDEAVAFTGCVMPRSVDETGFELITEEGGMPLYIDVRKHRNIGIFATTRAGKSVLVSAVLSQALCHEQQIVALDFPKPDGTSTFTDYTHFIGELGAYFDISKESSNLLELPDLRAFDSEQAEERLRDFKSFVESALMTMVFGASQHDLSSSERQLRQLIRALLVPVVNAFFDDEQIKARYDKAIADGFGTEAWSNMPTLSDFLDYFLTIGKADITSDVADSEQIDQATNQIVIQLRFWLNSRIGRAISRPSTFRSDARLLVFALRNLSEAEDAAILALSAYSAALRRALSSPASILFIDEAPILFEYPTISEMVARLCANGAKAGIKVIISAQDPDTIARSPSAPKILQNLSTRLIGRIQPSAVDSFVSILKYPREVIAQNAEERFFPKREAIYSQWLLDDAGIYTFVRFFPSYIQLGVVANNPDEQEARTAYMLAMADPYKGLAAFSREMASALRDGRKLKLPELAA